MHNKILLARKNILIFNNFIQNTATVIKLKLINMHNKILIARKKYFNF